MMRFIIIPILFFVPLLSNAQGDMLLLKKKSKVVRSYFSGSSIYFDNGFGMKQAQISRMKNDSLFLVQYQIRRVVTTSGFAFPDTLGTYGFTVAYRDIDALAEMKHGWDWQTSGAALFGGGAVVTTAGLLTWVFSKKDTRYYARPGLVISAAALTGVGYLLMQVSPAHKWKIGRKYSLQYISTN